MPVAEIHASTHPLHLENFEGPLHLLLFLVRKNQMNIYDIPIAEITEQFLEVVATGLDLEEVSEFHLMAATLLYIKSRLLLPMDFGADDEMDDPKEELVHKLIEYERLRKLTELVAAREEESDWLIERRHVQAIIPFPDEEDPWDEFSAWDLLNCFSKIMKSLGREQVINLWEEVSVNEKITLIREFLNSRAEFSFGELILHRRSALETICTFFAVLELVRQGNLGVQQNRVFGDIRLLRHER